MIIAAAQVKPFKNNTDANIQGHLRVIKTAAQNKVQLIVFPEMSLTGYERELADELSFSENDSRLEVFKEKSALHQMIIIVGAPIKINLRLYIGAFVFTPGNPTSIYTKQFLHEGEEKYFSPNFNFNPVIEFNPDGFPEEKISIAICADISNPRHPAMAAKNKTSLYVAGIFCTPNGIKKDFDNLGNYAKKYAMNVLMANYCGVSYGLEAGGQSAFWNNKGELMGQMDQRNEGLLIVEKIEEKWKINRAAIL